MAALTWSHNNAANGKDEWLTPPHIIKALSEEFDGSMFDLDPCAPVIRPWPTAKRHFTIEDNGLALPWEGRVWCTPPYNDAARWLQRCADHGNVTALTFARTETKMFFSCVWDNATAILFLKGRLTFLNIDGSQPDYNSGASSCLIAYGEYNARALLHAITHNKLTGKLVTLKSAA